MSLAAVHGSTDQASVGSGGEIESQLTPWLGPPNQFAPLNLDIEGKNPHVTHNLPLAYWGKSKAMENVIEFQITKKGDWYTTDLMPWEATEELNMQWMVFKYDKSFFEVEPYGGNPNYIQSSIEAYGDKMIQRGMAFTIAHGFWKTEMGREQYRMNFEVLESSAQLTIYHLIIMALLKAKNSYRNWELRFKNPTITIPQALKRMKLRWAILNKGMHLFRQYSADLVEVMESRGVKPNIWGLPPKTKILMSHKHKSEYDYDEAGPISQNVRKNGQSAYDSIRGIKIYETTVFNEIMFGQMYNPLRRIREFGSFFWITNYHGSANLKNYRNEDRFAAKILDASKDGQETKVTGRPLFRLSGRFSSNGELSPMHNEMIRTNNLNDLRTRLHDSPSNNYIDMFIGYDPSLQNPLHVMKYMGEMWESDVSDSDLRDFAITASNKLSSLTQEDTEAIDTADQFMDDLNNVDFNDPRQVAYWRAVSISSMDDAQNKVSGGLLKANEFGTVDPVPVTPYLGVNKGGVYSPLYFHKDNGTVIFGGSTQNATGILADGSEDAGKNISTVITKGLLTSPPTYLGIKDHKLYSDLLPWGYGHPAGLATLDALFRRKDFKGYPEETLKKASVHLETLKKFHSVWKHIFPDHELGSARACPTYFRSSSQSLNELVAFGLNLYSHARYPVFVTRPAFATGVYTFTEAASEVAENAANVYAKLKAIFSAKLTAGPDTQDAFLKKFVETTDSPEVKEALIASQTEKADDLSKRLAANYRNKQYTANSKALGLDDFLATVLTGNYGTEEKKVKIFTSVLEILLRDGYSDPVNWNAEINSASERPIRIAKVPFKNSAREVAPTSFFGFNSRLVISPNSFRMLAEEARNGDDAKIKSIWSIPVRPMNVFNPLHPIGLYNDATTPAKTAAVDHLKNAIGEYQFASAPDKRNSVHSLTISPILAGHLDSSASTKVQNTKRSLPEDMVSTSGPMLKRTLGGIQMAPSLGSVVSQEKNLFGGIPLSKSTYGGPLSYDPSSESGAIPMNIALDRAFEIFTLNDTITLASGQAVERVYKTRLVSRFHSWAEETNPVHRIMVQSLLTSKIHLKNFETFWDQDCIPLVSFELWRIRQRYYMGSGFLAEGGPRLGKSFHGHHDFQWSDDIIRKVHVGHYTFNFACPVKDPKMYALAEDIVAMGHIPGGENVTFCQGLDDFKTLCTDPDNSLGCILVKMTPYNRELPASPQDIGGRWNPTIVAQCSTEGMSDNNPIHGDQAYFYDFVYGLDRLNVNLVTRESIFHSPYSVVNTVSWIGHHRIYNINTGLWTGIILDDGPFGSNVYKGCISDRDITGRPIQDMKFEQTCEIYS